MLAAADAGMFTSAPIGTWLTDDERHPPAIPASAALDEVLALFERHAGLRMLPIIDDERRPQGAIFDHEVRRLLLNPFGRALRQNPAYRGNIADLSRSAPMAEADRRVIDVVDHYRRSSGAEGMILTEDGRLYAVVTNARLIHLAAEHELARERNLAARGQAIEAASAIFQVQVAELIGELNAMAHAVKMQANATAIRSNQTGQHAASVAAAVTQSSDNLTAVETQGLALGVAFAAIDGSTRDAKNLALDAVQMVKMGTQRTGDLARSVGSIEGVIQLIGDISRQVSLLALNAGIEAARAGDAGRGFAVVAQEVKALSHQTAKAADQVGRHILDIQTAVAAVADGNRAVAGTIANIDARSGAIELAVADQAASTRTIARHLTEATQAATAIQHDADAIATNARAAADNAVTMRNLADQFTDKADRLTTEANRFLDDIRAC